MNIVVATLVLACGLVAACSTTSRSERESARLPMLCCDPDEVLRTKFEQAPVELQPWLKGERLPPASLTDLGLGEGLRLIDHGVYLDGGSQAYVLCDAAGHFFAFCTSNPRDAVPAFLLGGRHFTEPNLVRVAEGTRSYRFFFDLVWALADDPRYQCSREILERTRQSLGMSQEELARLLKKPSRQ